MSHTLGAAAAIIFAALLAVACDSPPPRTVEVIKEVEVPVEVVKEVVRTVEVPVEVIKEVEVPVEVVKEVVRTVEVEVIKEVEVPVEVVKEVVRTVEVVVTPAPSPTPSDPPTPTPVPAHYKIAFSSGRDGNYEIYTADSDGRNVKRITFTSFDEHPYDWSQDGNMISYDTSFTQDDNRRSLIFTANADGANQRPIREELGGSDGWPVFSPSGEEVVFMSNRSGSWDIYTIGVDGANPRQITFSDNDDIRPDWSPDGRHIAYSSERDGNWQIYLVDIQTGDERRITSGIANNRQPKFSPNGKEIAYHSISGDPSTTGGITELFVLDLESLAARQVTRLGKSSCCTSWSPDAKFIYFEIYEEGQSDIYRISPDGGFPEAIVQSESYEGRVVVSPFIER